jgi:hypothetical protein
MVYTNA